MKTPALRCAIYTRKSHEDGLEQEFNSLDAQREACAAYIKSQAGEGWEMIRLGDSQIVNFRSVVSNPNIHFVHANGFVATTKNLLPLEEVLDLASKAIKDVDS